VSRRDGQLWGRLWLCGAVALAILCGAAAAQAHSRSVSYAFWEIDGAQGSVTLELSELDRTAFLANAEGREVPLAVTLPRAVQLLHQGAVCQPEPESFEQRRGLAGRRHFAWQVRCAGPQGPWQTRSALLFEVIPTHVQLVTVTLNSGRTEELVLTGGKPAAEVAAAAARPASGSAWSAAGRFVTLGVEHILSGADHLVFLLTLVLIAASVREVALAITGFTVGHSITLSLAVLGFTRPDMRVVEALIGLSIVIMAADNVWLRRREQVADTAAAGAAPGGQRALPAVTTAAVAAFAAVAWLLGSPSLGLALSGVALFTGCSFGLMSRLSHPARLRGGLAALFGLVHGFGFAAALERLTASTERLAVALCGFNAGVELGQLLLLGLVWPLLLLLRRRGLQPQVVRWGSALAAGLGTFWFIERAFA